MPCLDENAIAAFGVGAIDAAVVAHLDTCADCRELTVAMLRRHGGSGVMRAGVRSLPCSRRTRRRCWRMPRPKGARQDPILTSRSITADDREHVFVAPDSIWTDGSWRLTGDKVDYYCSSNSGALSVSARNVWRVARGAHQAHAL